MIDARFELIIVTPVYEDRDASSKLFKELYSQFGDAVYVVAVDDGSVHQPLDPECLQCSMLNGVVLTLNRNVGHQRAISIGLAYTAERISDGQIVVIMDSDGEDLPTTIPQLVAKLNDTNTDVVVATRASRVETLRFKVFYEIYKRFFKMMTGRTINFGNFMALKAHAVRRLVVLRELPLHVASAVIASKLRAQTSPIHRGPRYAGQSKMNFVNLALHGFKAFMVFVEDVLVRVGIACSFVAFLSLLGIISAVVLKFIGFSTPGWFSIALGILVLIFMQTGMLALMSLLLTGVMRGGGVSNPEPFNDFIADVRRVNMDAVK